MCKNTNNTQDIEMLKNKVQNLELKLAVYALEDRLDMLEEILLEMQDTEIDLEDEDEDEDDLENENENENEDEDEDEDESQNKNEKPCLECGCR